ncbi:MAG: TetR/AcrR family transcriptional regulator [Actinobacteria bacterium]|nr:TetR/AcrR family transcriptional regulator [Actinomycetota bacterium]
MPTSNRALKENAILEATLAQLQETGTANISMQQIANRCSMTRSAVYQYFASVEDIFAELVINDMADLVNQIEAQIQDISDPLLQIHAWVEQSLAHLSDGQHAQIRKLSEINLADAKRNLLRILHGQFMLTLMNPVAKVYPDNAESACAYISAIVNSAANRIDAGADFEVELNAALKFVTAALAN